MKVSIFNDDSIAYWLDYSFRPDCKEVIEFNKEDSEKLTIVTHKIDLITKELVPINEDEKEGIMSKINTVPILP